MSSAGPATALLISLLLVAPSLAQDNEAEEPATSPTVKMAGRLGAVAGAARYCQLDPELREEYMAKAEARIATISQDDVELVVARIEFNNRFNLSSTRPPNGGCKQFETVFKEHLNSLS